MCAGVAAAGPRAGEFGGDGATKCLGTNSDDDERSLRFGLEPSSTASTRRKTTSGRDAASTTAHRACGCTVTRPTSSSSTPKRSASTSWAPRTAAWAAGSRRFAARARGRPTARRPSRCEHARSTRRSPSVVWASVASCANRPLATARSGASSSGAARCSGRPCASRNAPSSSRASSRPNSSSVSSVDRASTDQGAQQARATPPARDAPTAQSRSISFFEPSMTRPGGGGAPGSSSSASRPASGVSAASMAARPQHSTRTKTSPRRARSSASTPSGFAA
mmetsp:Transcript_6397/g.21928  ORF Transcript_6397/g.21928 Transcript_6397/m.21928 type:complete len:279 (+) Transcript_6397:584-1420(+)